MQLAVSQSWVNVCVSEIAHLQLWSWIKYAIILSTAVLELGVDGCLLLIQLLEHVPAEIRSFRFQYIADILSITLKRTITATRVKELVSESNQFKGRLECVDIGKPSIQLLWKATFTLAKPCTQFLAPPVSDCIMCGSSLTTHNKPVTTICYTIAGPIPAMKVSLRCDTCRVNYGYGKLSILLIFLSSCIIDMISMDVMAVVVINIMKITCVLLYVQAKPVLWKGHVTKAGVHLG